MELKYVKLLQDNNLTESSLSGKVLVGIREIKNTQKGVKLATDNGRKPAPATLEKLEWLDDMVTSIIQSTIDAKSKDNSEAERKAAEEQKKKEEAELAAKMEEQKKKEEAEAEEKRKSEEAAKGEKKDEPVKGDPKADKIDEDLAKALKDGKTKVKLEELKVISKTAYDIIFDKYEPESENGVITSNYSVLESEKEVFTINKL